MGPKPRACGLSRAAEEEEEEGMHPARATNSVWPVSRAPELPRRLFLPGGGK